MTSQVQCWRLELKVEELGLEGGVVFYPQDESK